MKKDEMIATAAIIAFLVFMLIHALELRFVRRFAEMGSGFWPILTLTLAIVFSTLLLISHVRKYLKAKRESTGQIALSPEARLEIRGKRTKVALSMVCLLGYIIVLPYLGFVLSTFFYVLVFILALGERRRLVLVLSPFLVTALTIIIFGKLIAMPLPKGVDLFAAFSRLFY